MAERGDWLDLSDEDLELIRKIGSREGIMDLPASEALLWLKARREDLQREYTQMFRDRGLVAPYDAELFFKVMKATPGLTKQTTIHQAMEYIRLKKHRGHRQQEALEVWDAHYAIRPQLQFPSTEEVDAIDREFEEREKNRSASVS